MSATRGYDDYDADMAALDDDDDEFDDDYDDVEELSPAEVRAQIASLQERLGPDPAARPSASTSTKASGREIAELEARALSAEREDDFWQAANALNEARAARSPARPTFKADLAAEAVSKAERGEVSEREFYDLLAAAGAAESDDVQPADPTNWGRWGR